MNKYKGYSKFKILDEMGIQNLEPKWHILDTFIVNLGLTSQYYPTTQQYYTPYNQYNPLNPGQPTQSVPMPTADHGSICATNQEGIRFLVGLPTMEDVLYDGKK